MSSFPYLTLFISTLVLGSMMSISSSNWLMVWIGLELNLLSFVPLLTISKSNQENEASMKYFLSQALGSGLILSGALNLYFSTQTVIPSSLSNCLIILGLLVKLGLPPCHFWFPSVMSSISWPMCFMLSTWQKIVPLFLIIYSFMSSMNPAFLLLILSSSAISSLGGINQTLIKSILAYSSIGHMAWMIGGSMNSFSSAISYFAIYSLITLSIMAAFYFWSSSSIMSLLSSKLMTPLLGLTLILSLLSLGGVPPFLGFFPKWLVIQNITCISLLPVFILLISSMINLYYYLNILFITLIAMNKPILFSSFKLVGPYPLILMSASMTLFLAPLILLSL
uniref:NADH-ubiquinone oxidoreductase chain 2 n=1 Tax=Euthalenessa festiva TaxID=2153328 RepID=A0A343W6J3_9ANNE|nr:NADH dehydrogenase subunit 2 [Euthalenessa festiva]